MKHKTATLEGALLDAAVAKAEGLKFDLIAVDAAGTLAVRLAGDTFVSGQGHAYRPSFRWDHGGPIIERERINLDGDGPNWNAGYGCEASGPGVSLYPHQQSGPTPLIAAMRAFVAAKLGDEVDLP